MRPPPLAAAALAGLAGLAASAGPADHHPRVVTLAEFGAVWRRAPRFAFALDVCRARLGLGLGVGVGLRLGLGLGLGLTLNLALALTMTRCAAPRRPLAALRASGARVRGRPTSRPSCAASA